MDDHRSEQAAPPSRLAPARCRTLASPRRATVRSLPSTAVVALRLLCGA
ncbi:MAG TPA: hypothetical protein VF897_12695 [Roseiflexaceae bacterium]